MKKVPIIILVGLLMSTSSFAQFKLGVRAGTSINNIKILQFDNEPIQLQYDKGLGFHFGATSQIQISRLYVQPELIFSTVRHNVTLDDIVELGPTVIGQQRFTEMDIPLIIGLKSGAFKWGVGPVGTIVLNSKSELLDRYEMKQKTSSWGYQIGAGLDFKKFNIELRYEGNLAGLGSGVRIGNRIYNFDKRTSQLILTSAIYF